MNIKKLHPNFKMPTRGTEHAGGFDLYMPEKGLLMHTAEVKNKYKIQHLSISYDYSNHLIFYQNYK